MSFIYLFIYYCYYLYFSWINYYYYYYVSNRKTDVKNCVSSLHIVFCHRPTCVSYMWWEVWRHNERAFAFGSSGGWCATVARYPARARFQFLNMPRSAAVRSYHFFGSYLAIFRSIMLSCNIICLRRSLQSGEWEQTL